MESSTKPDIEVTETTAANEATATVTEEYKDLGEFEAKIVPAVVEKKVIPTASYGHRLRIAKLFDSHE